MKKFLFFLVFITCSITHTRSLYLYRHKVIKHWTRIIRQKASINYNNDMDEKIKIERLLMLLNSDITESSRNSIKNLYPKSYENMQKIINLLNKDLNNPEVTTNIYSLIKKL